MDSVEKEGHSLFVQHCQGGTNLSASQSERRPGLNREE